MWFKRRRKRTSVRKGPAFEHYLKHKEFARQIVHERLAHFNQFYDLEYRRVAIRNQKTCWGSCSEHGNLNFNYKVVFLPENLMDYIIVHELCHLRHLDHSPAFWAAVGEVLPNYKELRTHLRKMTHVPAKGFPSSAAVAYLR